MPGMTVSLKASALIEVIVAALVLMIAFSITLGILAELPAQDSERAEWTEIITDIRRYYRESGGKEKDGLLTFGWGKMEVNVLPYQSGLKQVTLRVIPRRGRYRPVFVYLR